MKNALIIIGKVLLAGLVLAGAVIAIVGLLTPTQTMMSVRINNIRYLVDKQTLANGSCYYIYQSGPRVFIIPCEEKR